MKKDGTGFSVILHFGFLSDDGKYPHASVIEGSDSVLYGTTYFGGTGERGIVFRINKDGTAYAVLHRFDSAAKDGTNPEAALVEGRDGKLYGTTVTGGPTPLGTVFRMNKDGTAYELIWNFGSIGGDGNGYYPIASLLEGSDGSLYGTTSSGGSAYRGTVFKVNKDGMGYAVLHSFQGQDVDGSQPESPLIEASDGALYGTTRGGGVRTNATSGTVFRLNKDGTGYQILRTFEAGGSDGLDPWAGLAEGVDGMLYGTTYQGGSSNNVGTVFRLNKDGTAYSVIVSFLGTGGDGGKPHAALLVGSDGVLYGTTMVGGEFGYGTVFSIIPPQPAKLSLVRETNGLKRVTGIGSPSTAYAIQATEQLTAPVWQALVTNIADIQGRFELLDTNSVNYESRFYRSVKQ